MIVDQCISITKLRTKTKECLEDLDENEKYIFVNNKPVAVLIDVKDFEEIKKKSGSLPEIKEIDEKEVTADLKKKAEKAKKIKKSDLVNI